MGEYEKPMSRMPSPGTRGDTVDDFSKTPDPNAEESDREEFLGMEGCKVLLNIIFSHGTQVNTVEVSPQEAEPLAKGAQLDWSSPVLELRWNGKGAFIRTTLLRHTAQEQSPRDTMAPQAGRHQPQ